MAKFIVLLALLAIGHQPASATSESLIANSTLISELADIFKDYLTALLVDDDETATDNTTSSTEETTTVTLSSDEYWGPEACSEIDESINSFEIDVPKAVIEDLKARLEGTRTFRKPLVGANWTYGVNSDYLQTVLEYWRTEYNWTERQALLNKYPQYKTNIQGLDIHFYHVKPTLPENSSVSVLPLLLVHGWPGSVVEFQKVIPLLTTPRSDLDFVFEVIVPSIPGYGFSDAAVRPGLGGAQIAVVFKNLMNRLGFEKFYTQGGDWGSAITVDIGVLYPSSVYGIHLNLCYLTSLPAALWTIIGSFFPSLVVSEEYESRMYPLTGNWLRLLQESGYLHSQATKPDTVGLALTDSPAGLAGYILEKIASGTNPNYTTSEDGLLLEKFTIDELLDNIMLYWVTNSITTSVRMYAETFNMTQISLLSTANPIEIPTGCAIFPNEIGYQSESILQTRYANLIQMSHLPQGGHFAALEEPQLLADDIWSFVFLVEATREAEETTEIEES